MLRRAAYATANATAKVAAALARLRHSAATTPTATLARGRITAARCAASFSDNASARAPLTKSPFCDNARYATTAQNVACILCDVVAYPHPTPLPRGRPPTLATRSVCPRGAARLIKRPKMGRVSSLNLII